MSCSTHERWKIARAVHSKGTCILDDMPSKDTGREGSAAEIDSACATTSLFACLVSTQAPPRGFLHIAVPLFPSCCRTLKDHGHSDMTGNSTTPPTAKQKGSKKSPPSSCQPYPRPSRNQQQHDLHACSSVDARVELRGINTAAFKLVPTQTAAKSQAFRHICGTPPPVHLCTSVASGGHHRLEVHTMFFRQMWRRLV